MVTWMGDQRPTQASQLKYIFHVNKGTKNFSPVAKKTTIWTITITMKPWSCWFGDPDLLSDTFIAKDCLFSPNICKKISSLFAWQDAAAGSG